MDQEIKKSKTTNIQNAMCSLLIIEFEEYLKTKPEFKDEESLHRYYLSYEFQE
jgi:hypothetical protein